MQWPSRAEYTEAVRDYPHISLQDPKLKGGKPVRGKDNFVISDTGAFSIVFPIDMVSKTFALRCWVKEVGNVKNRYEKITAYLKQVNLPYFIDFEYVPEGILVNGIKYPITRMEWAEGVSLREFIEQNLQNPHAFKVIADEFQKMVSTLHKHGIAHGDLQDGNILLKRNSNNVEIKLIDYDSLFVPKLRGQPEQILGLPEYQHPKRMVGSGQANEKADYFSELVIYLSFLSLAEKPELWNQFKDKTERGLLFSKEDFENPDKSDIFQALEKLSSDVQQLAATLKDFCAKTSIDQLAPLEAILPKSDANTYCNQGESFLSDKRYDEALAEFQKAIDIKPDYARAYFGRGHVYRRTKRYANAIIAFQQAIKFKPNYKEAHYGLALAYFESGDNSKAKAAADATLKIDPYYQLARDLLDVIKTSSTPSVTPPPTTKSTPTSTSPISRSTPSQSTRSNHVTNVWRYVTSVLGNSWHFVTIGTLSLALVICFIAFLTQMNAKDEVISQNARLKNQFAQKESEIQELTSSVRSLEILKDVLSRKNGELQDQLKNNPLSKEVVSLRKQLSDKEEALASWVNENQKLRSQLAEKNTELRTQISIVQGLQNEKTDIRNENRNLQDRNKDIVRQNQELISQKTMLQSQLDGANQEDSNLVATSSNHRDNELPDPALPKTVSVSKYLNSRVLMSKHNKRATSNNKGVNAFYSRLYSKAITHFSEATKIDSKFAIAHYNLGCTYLEMKEYRKATVYFNRAAALDQKFKEAYYNLGLAWFRMNTFQAAKQAIKKSLKIDTNYHRALNLLAAIENAQQ